jgi:hypothetical protein
VEWIHLAQDWEQWRAFVSTVMNFVFYKMRVISWLISSCLLSKMTLAHVFIRNGCYVAYLLAMLVFPGQCSQIHHGIPTYVLLFLHQVALAQRSHERWVGFLLLGFVSLLRMYDIGKCCEVRRSLGPQDI